MTPRKPARLTARQKALLIAATSFRDSLVPQADEMRLGYYPLWHGWALHDAFVAGAKWADALESARQNAAAQHDNAGIRQSTERASEAALAAPEVSTPTTPSEFERRVYRIALERIIDDETCDPVEVAHRAITPYTKWRAVDEKLELAAPDGPAGRDDPTPIESASLTAAPVPAVPSLREVALTDLLNRVRPYIVAPEKMPSWTQPKFVALIAEVDAALAHAAAALESARQNAASRERVSAAQSSAPGDAPALVAPDGPVHTKIERQADGTARLVPATLPDVAGERDAARYRWLRDTGWPVAVQNGMMLGMWSDVDAAIDAAMPAEGRKE